MWSQWSHPKLHCLCILRKVSTPANAHLWLLTSIEFPLPALPSGDNVAIIHMRKSGFFFLLISVLHCFNCVRGWSPLHSGSLAKRHS